MSVLLFKITPMKVAGPATALTEALERATSAIAAASAEVLRAVAEYDECRLWRRDGATSMTSWLAGRYGLAWGTAREWVRVAHALRGLPRIAEAFAAARLSWDQLRPLTKFATSETDARWARKAPDMRPATLYREARRHERIRTEDAREIHRRRTCGCTGTRRSPPCTSKGCSPRSRAPR